MTTTRTTKQTALLEQARTLSLVGQLVTFTHPESNRVYDAEVASVTFTTNGAHARVCYTDLAGIKRTVSVPVAAVHPLPVPNTESTAAYQARMIAQFAREDAAEARLSADADDRDREADAVIRERFGDEEDRP